MRKWIHTFKREATQNHGIGVNHVTLFKNYITLLALHNYIFHRSKFIDA